MHIRTLFPATLGLLVLAGVACAMPPADIETRVRDFVEAANRHDVDAMLAASEPGFRWMQVAGDRVEVEVSGHDQLRSWLEGYFRTTPDSRSTLAQVSVDGAYASAVETVEYRSRDGELKRQSATSVYEFGSGGLIRNVWYFPAQPAAPTP
jgi:ketosteroid isomerase-like protein